MNRALTLLACAAVWVLPAIARQTAGGASLEGVVNATMFRNIGPFRTGAWVTEIAVPEAPAREHLYTIYAATRSGGLWKTTNNGITWAPISDSVEVGAVGAVAVAPSNSNVVWMGTGDQASARSSYSGKGVFKSTDAGQTWQLMGLPDSHHIARIVIHPANPETVYVAAMGHLFSRNEERGVFRTRDGGKTWQKVLYVDDGTGAIDLVINRQAPNTLFAAMYEKHRTPWQLVLGGPGSGVHRSDDGGTTWRKGARRARHQLLPARKTGRGGTGDNLEHQRGADRADEGGVGGRAQSRVLEYARWRRRAVGRRPWPWRIWQPAAAGRRLPHPGCRRRPAADDDRENPRANRNSVSPNSGPPGNPGTNAIFAKGARRRSSRRHAPRGRS